MDILKVPLDADVDADGKFPPFDTVAEFKAAALEAGIGAGLCPDADQLNAQPQYREALAVSIGLLNEFSFIFSSWATALLVKSDLTEIDVKRRCSISLLSGMSSDLKAMSALIEEGLDTQARSLARNFGEKLDLLIAVQIDRGFAVQYCKNSDEDNFFKFWKKEVKAGRLERRVSKRLGRLSESGKTPIDESWTERRKASVAWLSQAVHSSYTAGWFSLLPDLGDEPGQAFSDEHIGLFGRIGLSSISTVRAVYARFFEIFVLLQARRGHLLAIEGASDELVEFFEAQERFIKKCMTETYLRPH